MVSKNVISASEPELLYLLILQNMTYRILGRWKFKKDKSHHSDDRGDVEFKHFP